MCLSLNINTFECQVWVCTCWSIISVQIQSVVFFLDSTGLSTLEIEPGCPRLSVRTLLGLWLCDTMTMPVPVRLSFIRIGCFWNLEATEHHYHLRSLEDQRLWAGHSGLTGLLAFPSSHIFSLEAVVWTEGGPSIPTGKHTYQDWSWLSVSKGVKGQSVKGPGDVAVAAIHHSKSRASVSSELSAVTVSEALRALVQKQRPTITYLGRMPFTLQCLLIWVDAK